jgi:hypothetical protein
LKNIHTKIAEVAPSRCGPEVANYRKIDLAELLSWSNISLKVAEF